ncbi:DUF1796 family putative cysteine peptidase [Dyella soli]|uniref:DUF4214 domain-containing protein n=1 Tax=Dyella soli TaxID=522319 RepID=A0A4V2NLH6_9GAMM|nr:DUF1796 family putative cysteine peptidase [Dyella soli]TCI08953.1 hypothetical protein EZM97_22180 [Dyella soli]
MDHANRQLIDSLYRQILGRAADEGGLVTYDRLLSGTDRDRAIAESVRCLLASAEYKQRATATHDSPRPEFSAAGSRLINGKKIGHIVSIGTHCLTSFLLKKHGLKQYSLPFDWLFSSPATILHCLEDSFATFLDAKHYSPVTSRRASKEPGADHLFYRHRHGVGDMFAHRDPSTPDDYRYLQKTVYRFNKLMALPDAKLFVMIARPVHNAIRAFPLISDKIRSMTENSAFLCIQLREPTLQPGCHSMNLLRSNDDHALYEFQPSSGELGIGFDELIDDLAIMRLVRQFDRDLTDIHVPIE